MSRPSAGLLNFVAAATFAIIGVLQLTNRHSDEWLSFVASVLLVNAARTSLRRKLDAGGCGPRPLTEKEVRDLPGQPSARPSGIEQRRGYCSAATPTG